MPAQEVGSFAAGFAGAALRYWLLVFPRAGHELRRVRRRASQIRAPEARRLALEALGKRSNLEGAAAFATFVPWRRRGRTVRALVAFQAVYNYVDLLAEQPIADPVARAQRLHRALQAALDTNPVPAALPDSDLDDDGLLAAMVERCRSSLSALPAHAVVASAARAATQRIVTFQSLSLGGDDALERWAESQIPPGSELAWWEVAGATGSSLLVHALIAAAASASLDDAQVAALERAYFPWPGALHSLLDSLVDEAEDAASAQVSLIACYDSPLLAARRMRWLAAEALIAARALPGARRHALLLTAMACSYVSVPWLGGDARQIAREVRAALGPAATAALLVFRIRHRVACIAGTHRERAVVGREASRTCIAEPERGADAGVA